MKITEENYELYLFQYAEGMLSDKERREVEAFLDSHPDIREEFALYDPKLTVAGLPKMKYEGKAALKHNTFALWPVLRYAAAVLLLAAVVAFFLLRNGESTKPNTPEVAENQIDTTTTQPLQDSMQDTETSKQPQTATTPAHQAAQHANKQQIARKATPISESHAENAATPSTPLLAETHEPKQIIDTQIVTKEQPLQDNTSDITFIPDNKKVTYTEELISYINTPSNPKKRSEQSPTQFVFTVFGDMLEKTDIYKDLAASVETLQRKTRPGIEKISAYIKL